MAETVKYLRIRVVIDTFVEGDDGASFSEQLLYSRDLSDGTGSNQVQTVWLDRSRALNTTSEDLDVRGGLTDFQGVALTGAKLKVIMLENLDTDSGDYLLLKPGSANPVTSVLGGTNPTLTIGAGGLVLLVNPVDGYATTAGSADKIAVEAADNSTYKLFLAATQS